VGAEITDVERPPCTLRPISIAPEFARFRRKLVGKRVLEVGRRGKRVLLCLSDRAMVVIEPRMTGLVLLADPPGPEHLRLRISLRGGGLSGPGQMLFWDRRGLGTVRWLSEAEVRRWLVSGRLGPDALEITCEELKQRLGTSRRPIKVALMDQQRVAGIGNLYASEILFLAGVDPRAACHRLSVRQWQAIQHAIGYVLRLAIEHEGSTLSDGTYRNALNNPGGYQNHHRVYDRHGTRCVRCGEGEIQRIVQAQRSTFYCPGCQRRRGVHPAATQQIG
jgi:formamidopyrimidine-DNA glycosylase